MARLRVGGGSLRVTFRAVPTGGGGSTPSDRPVAHWKASLGVAGPEVAVWTDQIGAVGLTPVSGSPTTATLPSNRTAIRFTNGGNSMTGKPGGGWPSGNEPGTIIACLQVDNAFYQGVGYGASGDGQARTIGIDESGFPMFDFRGSRLLGPVKADGRLVVLAGTHDGTTSRLYVDGSEIASVAQTLITGSTAINVMRSWGGTVANGYVCEWLVYDRALGQAEITAKALAMIDAYVGDATAPVTGTPAIVATGVEDALIQVTIDEPGNIRWALTTSATPLSSADIKVGTGAVAFGNTSVASPGTIQIPATGLTGETTYYPQVLARDLALNEQAAVSVGSGVETDPAPGPVPVVTIDDVTPATDGAIVEWSTTDANGAAYYLVSSSEVTSAATVISTGVLIGAVTASGPQTDITLPGLPAGVVRWVAIVHVDLAGQPSNVARQQFSTEAAASAAADAVVSSAAALIAQVDAWIADGSRTLPKVIALNTTVGTVDLTGRNNAGKPMITIRPTGTYSGSNADDVACSVRTGSVILTNARNITVYGMHVRSTANPIVPLNGSFDITLNRCLIEGTAQSSGPVTSPTFTLRPRATTRLTVKDCVISRGVDALIGLGDGTTGDAATNRDLVVSGVVFDTMAHDNVKFDGPLDGGGFFDCWASRRVQANAGSDYHNDFFQVQKGPISNFTWSGNVQVYTPQSWLNGASPDSGAYQGLHFRHVFSAQGSTLPITNILIEQNILATSSNTANFASDIIQSNVNVRLNTFIKVSTIAGQPNCGALTKSLNYAWSPTASTAFGTNSIVRAYGSNGSPNFTGASADFANGVPFQNATGTLKTPPGMIEDIEPAAGAPIHWDYSGTRVGAYLRSREIFDPTYRATLDKQAVPGDVGWPVAPAWEALWNANGEIPTTWTGKYDEDGNNG